MCAPTNGCWHILFKSSRRLSWRGSGGSNEKRECTMTNIYKIFVIFETHSSSTLPARSQQERWRKRKRDIQLSYIRWSNWEELIQVWIILLTHLCHCASKQRHKRHTRSHKQSGLARHSGTRGNLRQRITKVTQINLLGTMNVCAKILIQ